LRFPPTPACLRVDDVYTRPFRQSAASALRRRAFVETAGSQSDSREQMTKPTFTRSRLSRKRAKAKQRGKKKDPIFVDGRRPRPMYVDYKDVELLKKLTNRQGKIISRRKSGCTAVSQHAVTRAIKRARYMALLPYVGE